MTNKNISHIKKICQDNSDGIIVRAKCKLCNSEFRSEAENMYAESSNISAVYRFLESKGEKMSLISVRSHLLNHYTDFCKQERLNDYVADLERWRDTNLSREERLKNYLGILEKRIFQIASFVDKKDDLESIKNTDILAKLIAQASSIQSQIDEHDQRVEPARVVIKKLQEIIEIRVKTSKNQELKNHLIDLVSDLQGNIGGLLGDG
jgi:hypothetical protein